MLNVGIIKKYISTGIREGGYSVLVNYQSLLPNFLPIALLIIFFSKNIGKKDNSLSFIELTVLDFTIYQVENFIIYQLIGSVAK